ncbi:MAG: hypothetical protein Q9213_008093 [Squamulea squamosa]
MDRSELKQNSWLEYEAAVRKFLDAPENTGFLNKQLDQCWMEDSHKEAVNGFRQMCTTISCQVRNKIDLSLGLGIGILFWVTHITAALGFVLIANTSGSENLYMVEFSLAYWYFSAVGIVVQGCLSNGRWYALKVIVGGIIFSLTALCVLHILLSIPTSSAVTAMPSFFTVVLLLVRTL